MGESAHRGERGTLRAVGAVVVVHKTECEYGPFVPLWQWETSQPTVEPFPSKAKRLLVSYHIVS